MPHRLRPSFSAGNSLQLVCSQCTAGRVRTQAGKRGPLLGLPAPAQPVARCTHNDSSTPPRGPWSGNRTGNGPQRARACHPHGTAERRAKADPDTRRLRDRRAAGPADRNVRIGYRRYLYRRVTRLLMCCRRLMIAATQLV